MQILFLTTVLPDGLSTGGEIASQSVVDALAAQGHEVTVLGYRREGEAPRTGHGIVEAGVRPIENAAAGLPQKLAWMGAAVRHALPYSAAKFRSSGYRDAVRELVAARRFDLAIVDHAQAGWVQPHLRRAGLPFTALLHNVEHRIYADRAAAAGPAARVVNGREARRVRSLEEGLAQGARAVWVLSDDDGEHFAGFADVRTLRLPSALRVADAPAAKSRDAVLIGTWTWDLTRRGLEWFLESVCPLLPDGFEVAVAGRGGEWVRGADARVSYSGLVPDAGDFLATARAVAVPSLGGTGVQVKTLDAIASGSLVVTTGAGVRGLGQLPDSVRVADTAEEFAAELTRAAGSPESAERNDAGLRWSQARREQFAADVGAAVEAAARAA